MKKCFTMVELVIVLAVLSVLAILLIGKYNTVVTDANIARVKSELKSVKDSVSKYIAASDYIPVNDNGVGVSPSKFVVSNDEYVILNVDLLLASATFENGKTFEPIINNVLSSRYLNANNNNSKKQEPSFIYVIDNKLNVFLADAVRDKDTGYHIETKIYETAEANIYDKKYKMSYVGFKPILNEVDENDDGVKDDSTVIGGGVTIPGDILIPETDGPHIEDENYNKGTVFYRNLSTIGFTAFIDIPNVDYSKVKYMKMDVSAGGKTLSNVMHPVSTTRWMLRINTFDFNDVSGYYTCKISTESKDGKKADIYTFDLLIDRVKPSVNIVSSKSGFYTTAPILVDISAADAEPSSGIAKLEYKINDRDWVNYSNTIKLSDVGYYEILARATDCFGNVSDVVKIIINDYTKPELYVTHDGKNVSMQAGIYIRDEDVVWKTGFEENDFLPTLTWNPSPLYGLAGGQSFIKEDCVEGERCYSLLPTIGGNGNHYVPPRTSSDNSIMLFNTIPGVFVRDEYIAVTYRYNSVGKSWMDAVVDGGRAEKIYYYDGISAAKPSNVGDKVIYVNINKLKVGEYITTDTIDGKIENLHMIESVNSLNNTITLKTPLKVPILAGETLKYRPHRRVVDYDAVSLPPTNSEWRLASTISKVYNFDDFDPFVRGGRFYFTSSSEKGLFVDDVRIGRSPRVLIYKNGEQINRGNEYATEFKDSNLVDAMPPKINHVACSLESGNFDITIQAEDFGSKYDYQMKSIYLDGSEKMSSVRSVTEISGVAKYKYIINNSPSISSMNGSKETPDKTINITLDKNKKWYIHIQAIDGSNNYSQIFSQAIN